MLHRQVEHKVLESEVCLAVCNILGSSAHLHSNYVHRMPGGPAIAEYDGIIHVVGENMHLGLQGL